MTTTKPAVSTDNSPLDKGQEVIKQAFNDGILIDLDVRFWTGQKKLESNDIGLDADKLPPIFSLGRKRLIPPEVEQKWRVIEGRMRVLVENNSYPFPIGGARFVPRTALYETVTKLDALVAAYKGEIKEFLKRYESIKTEMKPAYEEAAELAYENSTKSLGKKEFVERFMQKIDNLYPSKEALEGKFGADYRLFEVSVPSLPKEDLIRYKGELEKSLKKQSDMAAQWQRDYDYFLENVIKVGRERVEPLVDSMLSQIVKGDSVAPKTLKAFSEAIDSFKKLNFIGDDEMKARLEAFRDSYLKNGILRKTPASYRKSVTETLEELKRFVEDKSDISSVTGSYKRRLQFA